MVTHSLLRKSACDGRKGGRVDGAKKEECLTAERTWKYDSVARTKKNTMVSIGEDAAWIEIGRMKALITGKRWEYASKSGGQGLAAIGREERVRKTTWRGGRGELTVARR
jgi:hypothetical protein